MNQATLYTILDLLEDGDTAAAVELLLDAIEDGPVLDLHHRRRACAGCGRTDWPGALADHDCGELTSELRRAA